MSLYPVDKSASLVGLFGGALLVLAMVLGFIKFTNAQFASHEAPAAEATR